MDIRKTGQATGDNRSPTLEKLAKRRKEDRQRTGSSSSTGSQTDVFSVIPDPSVVPVEISGNLHKQGRLLKKWKPRFFQVQGNSLYYCKNYEKKECLGLIDLQKCYYIGKSTAASFGFAFELQTWGRTHLLAARDEREADKWIKVIKKKMVPEARERGKRGSKEDVIAHIPDQVKTRRATIKMNRSERKRGTVVPSSSAQDMSLSALKSLEEEQENEDETDNIPLKNVTASQSYPEFKSHQTNTATASTGNHNTVTPCNEQEKKTIQAYSPIKRSLSQTQNNTASCPSVTQSIADMELPPPLDTSPVSLRPSDSSLPPAVIPPKTKRLDSDARSRPQLPKRSPKKQVSVEDIVLPPPPSLVPIKRPSISKGQPHNIPHTPIQPLPDSMVDLPPPINGEDIKRTPFESKTSVADLLPPPITETALTNVELDIAANTELPPPLDWSSLSPQALICPEEPHPMVDVMPATGNDRLATVDVQFLMDKMPPLDPSIDNIPSAIDQLRYILLKDDGRQFSDIYSTKEYALLPEISKPWLSEETGIEQLRSFLVECHN